MPAPLPSRRPARRALLAALALLPLAPALVGAAPAAATAAETSAVGSASATTAASSTASGTAAASPGSAPAASTAAAVRAAVRTSTAAAGAHPLGYDRLGVRRGSTWILGDALDGRTSRAYAEGAAGWLPVAGDLDGDGSAAPSLFRDGTWQLRDREGGPARTVRFGQRGDLPVVGDWDGDGTDTLGLFRAGRWYLRAGNGPGTTAARSFGFGLPGDVPVVGDWDADGDDDLAVRRGATWYQRDDSTAGPASRTFAFGRPTDVPVAGDWDHDGRDTPGLYRDGTWYLRRGSFSSPYVTVRLGAKGDRPVVRRTQGLAPGVTHAVVRDPAAPWVAHVATVELGAASSPETVLSNEALRGTETLTSMTRRSGAAVAVNGDFFLGSGRPVHVHANDGQLLQSETLAGRALGLDPRGAPRTGRTDLRVSLTVRPAGGPARSVAVPRTNLGGPTGGQLAAYTSAVAGLETPPDGQCYATLRPAGPRTVRADGAVDTPLVSGGARCGGLRPSVPAGTTVVAAEPAGPGGSFVRALVPGTPVTMAAQLGAPSAVDAIGGGPTLVAGGTVSPEVDQVGEFYGRHPRTAVGVTADRRLLLVTVDGRQAGYSRGMTMRELAELLRSLGAVDALNLDGGGSTEMVLNGVIANRPSGGAERPLSNALVVLPGPDTGQADLAAVPSASASLGASLRGASGLDAGSTGGLADALVRAGRPVTAELRRAAAAFRAAR